MKITIFSFDLWGFNKKIDQELETLGNDVTYIDTSEINYVYKSFGDKILNFFSKSILKKNKKKTYFDAKINELINNLDPQDCCLIVNTSFFKPEVLDLLRKKTKKFIANNYDSLKVIPLPANYNKLLNKKKTYIEAKINELINKLDPLDCYLIVNPSFFKPEIVDLLRKKTKKFIAYNYDSLKRIPLPANYNQLFDKIYSFDLEDTKKNTFLNHLPNFNYQKKKVNLYPKNKAFIIISQSETREIILNKIANYFDSINIKNYQFIVHKPKLKKLNKNIKITNNHISLDEINLMMENSDILIDLVRPNQTGL